MNNLFEQLGQDLNPRAAQDILLSVNKDLSIKAEQQSFSSAYRESISNIATGIYNATNSLLEFLTQDQLDQLGVQLAKQWEIDVVAISKLGKWIFDCPYWRKDLTDMETSDVLTIMELTEKIILA